MRLLGAFLLLALPLSAQVTIYSGLGEDDVVLRLLSSRLPVLPRVVALDDRQELGAASGREVLLGVDIRVLHRLAQSGSLVPAGLSGLWPPTG